MPPTADRARPDAEEHPLSAFVYDFLERRREAEGDSYRALAARSKDPETGQMIRRPWLSDLASGSISRAPDFWRLRALAAGMGVPLRQIQVLAAQEWLGFRSESVEIQLGDDWIIVPVKPGTSPEKKAEVERWVRRFVESTLDDEDVRKPQ